MILLALILVGAITAAAMDWAIYTHLSAYLRAGFGLNRDLQFTELLCTKRQKFRFALVIASGVCAGIAFFDPNTALWIFALALFSLGSGPIKLLT